MKVNCPKCNSVNFLPSTLPTSIISNITCAVCKAVINVPTIKEADPFDDDLMDVSKLRSALNDKKLFSGPEPQPAFEQSQTASLASNTQPNYAQTDFSFQTPTPQPAPKIQPPKQPETVQPFDSGPVFLYDNGKSRGSFGLVKVFGIGLVVIVLIGLIGYFGLKIILSSGNQQQASAKPLSPNANPAPTLNSNNTRQTGGGSGTGSAANGNQATAKNQGNTNSLTNTAQSNASTGPANANQSLDDSQAAKNMQRERIAKNENKPTETNTQTSATSEIQGGGGNITIQVGSYSSINEASARAAKLQSMGITAQVVKVYIQKKRSTWFRVQVGRFASRGEAERFAQELKSKGATKEVFITEIGQ
jgi:cell division protein FtsN